MEDHGITQLSSKVLKYDHPVALSPAWANQMQLWPLLITNGVKAECVLALSFTLVSMILKHVMKNLDDEDEDYIKSLFDSSLFNLQ